MVKRLTFWNPADGVSPDKALEHWSGPHVQLVERVPGVQRYVQDYCSVGPDGKEPPYVGVGELGFESMEAANLALASVEWEAVIADARTFMDFERVLAVWVEERPVFSENAKVEP